MATGAISLFAILNTGKTPKHYKELASATTNRCQPMGCQITLWYRRKSVHKRNSFERAPSFVLTTWPRKFTLLYILVTYPGWIFLYFFRTCFAGMGDNPLLASRFSSCSVLMATAFSSFCHMGLMKSDTRHVLTLLKLRLRLFCFAWLSVNLI